VLDWKPERWCFDSFGGSWVQKIRKRKKNPLWAPSAATKKRLGWGRPFLTTEQNTVPISSKVKVTSMASSLPDVACSHEKTAPATVEVDR